MSTKTALRAIAAYESNRRRTILADLSPNTMALISGMAAYWCGSTPLTVSQAAESLNLGLSASTIHRILKDLRQRGLVYVVLDEHDQRIKYILPTAELLDALHAIAAR